MINSNVSSRALPAIREYDSLSYNPFDIDVKTNGFISHYTRPKQRDGFVLDDGVIEYEGKVLLKKELRTVDLTEFTKLFKGSFRILANLGNPAMNIMLYVVEHIKRDNDFIYLPIKEVLEYCGYNAEGSRILYYSGVKELLSKKIISPKTSAIKHDYWINPNILYKGDRVKLLKNNNQMRTRNEQKLFVKEGHL